jgi:hypothetical protein
VIYERTAVNSITDRKPKNAIILFLYVSTHAMLQFFDNYPTNL